MLRTVLVVSLLVLTSAGCTVLSELDCSEVEVIDNSNGDHVTVRAPSNSEIKTIDIFIDEMAVREVQVSLRRTGGVAWAAVAEGDGDRQLGCLRGGKREGFWIHFDRHGGVHRAGFYSNGLMHGQWKSWNRSGLSSGHCLVDVSWYKEGKQNGPYIEWDNDGNVKFMGGYSNNLEEGPWKGYYHGTKQLWIQGVYRAGMREGVWIEFHRNGRLASVGTYVHDVAVAETTWDENGHPR